MHWRSAKKFCTTLSLHFFSTTASTHAFSLPTFSTMAANTVLNHISPAEVAIEIKDPVDPTALEQAKAILEELRSGKSNSSTGSVSSAKLLEIGKRLGDIAPEATKYVVSAEECQAAFDGLSDEHRQALVNIHARVKAFAEAQRATVKDMEMDIPGGKAGHTVSACRGACGNGVFEYGVDEACSSVAAYVPPETALICVTSFSFFQRRDAMLLEVVILFLLLSS